MKIHEDEDINKQSNKGHRSLNQKLKKRRRQEKERKKEKKQKKKERERHQKKKHQKKKDHESSDSEDESEKLLKYIKKLRSIMVEEANDLFDMFESLDNGETAEIDGIENQKVKTYLKKIFKYLELEKNKETNEYTKNPEHTASLKKQVQDLWYSLLEDSDDSDNEGNKKGRNDGDDDDDGNSYASQQSGLDEEKKVDLQETKSKLLTGIVEEKEEKKDKNWKKEASSTLDNLFGKVKSDANKISSIGSKGQPKPEDYTKDEAKRDELIDEFMKDYNQQFRKKTLLEQHQEKKREKEAEKSKSSQKSSAQQIRKEFDRKRDLAANVVDSKKVISFITNKDISLSNRFSHSKSGKKYM